MGRSPKEAALIEAPSCVELSPWVERSPGCVPLAPLVPVSSLIKLSWLLVTLPRVDGLPMVVLGLLDLPVEALGLEVVPPGLLLAVVPGLLRLSVSAVPGLANDASLLVPVPWVDAQNEEDDSFDRADPSASEGDVSDDDELSKVPVPVPVLYVPVVLSEVMELMAGGRLL
jgi:hypothetical protein